MSTPRPRQISTEMRKSYDFKLKLIVVSVAGKQTVLLRESLTSSKTTYDDGDKTTENDFLHINGIGKSTTRAEKNYDPIKSQYKL